MYHLQQYFLAPGTVLAKSLTGAFFPQYGRLDVREVKAESVWAQCELALSRYFGMKILSLEN